MPGQAWRAAVLVHSGRLAGAFSKEVKLTCDSGGFYKHRIITRTDCNGDTRDMGRGG